MTLPDKISFQILEKAEDFDACLAGIATVEALKNSPSHRIYGKLDDYKGVGVKPRDELTPRQVAWPESARSVIVIAVHHPEEKPELDWWQDGYRGGRPGNQILMCINDKLSKSRPKNCPITLNRGECFSRMQPSWPA